MPELNVALVGCGIISGAHLRAYEKVRERARVVVCCDSDRSRAKEAAGSIGASVSTDYSDVLADPGIGAVDLCLPHHLHADMAVAAARAGKHILCEKPLALSIAECDAMIAAARAAGVVLMHGENMRMAENVERAAAMVQEGRLGTVVGLQATYAHWQREALNTGWRARPEESGGGHLMDGAIHWIDVLRHIGGDVAAVHAMLQRYRPELGASSEDTGVLSLRFSAGHVGQLFACHASRGRGAAPTLTVFGTEGCLSLDAPGQGSLVLYARDRDPEPVPVKHDWSTTFDREIAHFLDVVLDGAPLRARPEDGRENVRVVLAAYESARTGREVGVDEAPASQCAAPPCS